MKGRTLTRAAISVIIYLMALSLFTWEAAASGGPAATTHERIVEWTIKSRKAYADPFNDVQLDVIFSKDGQFWRVPTFWHGGQQWTVRFAPPSPGEYSYRLQSTDESNTDLNGHEGRINIRQYRGSNELLRQGALRVSSNGRYFEHVDGTPFFWLGDTWWTGLSDRLSWSGFKELTADRKEKGFTLVQVVAGLVPTEEVAPLDPGNRNEGGPVWDAQFARINPKYFDYADRRIQHLVNSGMVPAVVGAWDKILNQMGTNKMKQHWRYIIARYGAYPVFWIVGGEVVDPPESVLNGYPEIVQQEVARGWTEVARYVRAIDPYRHPITVHEQFPPFDTALQDETLTDFDMVQSSHFGWSSIAVEVIQVNQHYARTSPTRPVVQGEIGYEKLGESHFEDFQRTAFWLTMLNGAAGHTYGANGTWEAYTGDKHLHRQRWSFLSWKEGMNLPGSYQVGIASKLLRQYPWWRFTPHPEWVTPRGTTWLDARAQADGFAFGSPLTCNECGPIDRVAQLEADYPGGGWKAKKGTFRLPYAAGIAGEVRFVYVPTIGLYPPPPPTILGLEPGVRYNAYWWEPSSGTRFDLGAVERPSLSPTLLEDPFTKGEAWKDYSSTNSANQNVIPEQETLTVLRSASEANVVASVEATSATQAVLILRFQDPDNYIAAVYSPKRTSLFLVERRKGFTGNPLGEIAVQQIGRNLKLSMEARDKQAVASVTDGTRTFTTPIIDVDNATSGSAGVMYHGQDIAQHYANFRLWRSPTLIKDAHLERGLYDARGAHRGDLVGAGRVVGSKTMPGWSSFGLDKHILLDAYRPERLPSAGDWILVLEKCSSCASTH